MMCPLGEKFALRYADGQLSPDEKSSFEYHVVTCPHCQKVVASLADTDRRIAAGLAQELTGALLDSWTERLMAGLEKLPPPAPHSLPPWETPPVTLGPGISWVGRFNLGGMAVALLFLASLNYGNSPSTSTPKNGWTHIRATLHHDLEKSRQALTLLKGDITAFELTLQSPSLASATITLSPEK